MNVMAELRAAATRRASGCKPTNSPVSGSHTSGTTGVSWNRKLSKWTAMISHDKHSHYLGRFIEEHEGTLERFTGDGMMIFFRIINLKYFANG